MLLQKSLSSYSFANKKHGFTQTASVKSPYIYAEENWVDDMELAAAIITIQDPGPANPGLFDSYRYAKQEPHTPWLGKDTAKHYQWYPFINIGHYELAKQLKDKRRDTIIGYYKEGIQRVWNKAKSKCFLSRRSFYLVQQ